MERFGNGLIAIVAGVIGLAVVAVIVSRNAQTPTVLTSAGSALSSVINAAVQPVSGNNLGNLLGSSSNYGSSLSGLLG